MSLTSDGMDLHETNIAKHYEAATAMLRSQLSPWGRSQAFHLPQAAVPSPPRRLAGDEKDLRDRSALREYQVDKVGVRKALFGREAPMAEAKPTRDELIELVGPRGPVRR